MIAKHVVAPLRLWIVVACCLSAAPIARAGVVGPRPQTGAPRAGAELDYDFYWAVIGDPGNRGVLPEEAASRQQRARSRRRGLCLSYGDDRGHKSPVV